MIVILVSMHQSKTDLISLWWGGIKHKLDKWAKKRVTLETAIRQTNKIRITGCVWLLEMISGKKAVYLRDHDKIWDTLYDSIIPNNNIGSQ